MAHGLQQVERIDPARSCGRHPMTLTQPPAPTTNRRSALRRQPTLGTVCRLRFGPQVEPHLGLVWNLSSSGISMFLHEAPEPGAVLPAELATMDDGGSLPVTLRVVHIRPIRTGDY